MRLPDRWRHLGSRGWWVRKLSVVCLHNNAIVARCILDTNIALWATRTASAPSILLVLLEPHYSLIIQPPQFENQSLLCWPCLATIRNTDEHGRLCKICDPMCKYD